MKNTLRLALPRLADLDAHTLLDYAWFDRKGMCTQRGQLNSAALGASFAQTRSEAVLHPDDAIAATVQVPAVPQARFGEAVRSALEPLVLSQLDDLAIGHSTRAPDGSVIVAWAAREPLRRAWLLLSTHGLRLHAIIAPQTLAPKTDEPLSDPTDPRWRAPAPKWSLALPQLAPTRPSRWRSAWCWTALASLVWIAGLNVYASQLRREAAALQTAMHTQVREAFPELPVIMDPLRQAQQGLDALRASAGAASAADFLSLARAAAQILPFAADNVANVRFADQALTLQFSQTGKDSQHLTDTPTLLQQAAAAGIRLERTDQDTTWRIVRSQP